MNDTNLDSITPAALDRLRRDFDVIPIVATLSADTITPVSAFAALDGSEEEGFLLESVERGENAGRYSYVAVAPRRRLACSPSDSPLEMLREELRPLRVCNEELLPPFCGGAVGFFGYGAARWSERLPDRHRTGDDLPDATLLFFDRVLAFDHLRQTLFVIANVFSADGRSSDELLQEARQSIEQLIGRIRSATPDLEAFTSECEVELTSNRTRAEFVSMVERAQEAIAAGEIFQVVVSQRWSCDYPTNEALTLYRALRSVNPSPYMFLLRTAECTLVGSSPEMLVRLRSGVAETRPIAGTRPRGASPASDAQLATDLLADTKERAEHLMLVDLGRNDLGRVCIAGSVEVDQFGAIERYSHVMHLVSNVRGRLRSDVGPLDLLLAAFPAGTVSGAPKIRAMELIDELEPERRGIYAGAIACMSFGGSLDSCIAIRTIVLRDGTAQLQAGAGIVFDSVPEREYEESLQKSAALKRAIALAAGRLLLAAEASSPQPRIDSLLPARGEKVPPSASLRTGSGRMRGRPATQNPALLEVSR